MTVPRRRLRAHLSLAGALLLAGCAGAPAYHPAGVYPLGVASADTFRENGIWAQAGAVDTPAADWWRALGDPDLDALETSLSGNNPTLAAALARSEQARQALRVAQSDALPTIGSTATLGTDRQSDDRPLRSASQPTYYGDNLAGLGARYEVDLWGRVKDSVAAGRANAVAGADDAAAIRLSLQAQLATTYIVLRGLDAETDLLKRNIDVYRQADQVVRDRFAGGVATGIDTGRAGAQLADAEAQLDDVLSARANLEHAIACLIGTPASAFALRPAVGTLHVAVMPVGLPSTLLQRRPDVAAAERRMYAANRAIGVARAAFFPTIDLSAQGGTNATSLAGLALAGNAFWAVGPTLALTLFDGGRRTAQVRAARARWDEAGATYRVTALTAFQEVEDSLSALHHLGDEEQAATRAAGNAQQAADLSIMRYQKGVSNYLDVVTAQTTALFEQRRAIEVHTMRLNATVSLARALGGGWHPGKATPGRTPVRPGA
jgi:NodT family efflux transporter outer membrane factor (OMF) lipoprotein